MNRLLDLGGYSGPSESRSALPGALPREWPRVQPLGSTVLAIRLFSGILEQLLGCLLDGTVRHNRLCTGLFSYTSNLDIFYTFFIYEKEDHM